MTKKELVDRIAEGTNLTKKDVNAVYDEFLKAVVEEINKEENIKVAIPGLGTIKVVAKPARVGRNPKTKEAIQIPAKREARMSLSDSIKNKLVQK